MNPVSDIQERKTREGKCLAGLFYFGKNYKLYSAGYDQSIASRVDEIGVHGCFFDRNFASTEKKI